MSRLDFINRCVAEGHSKENAAAMWHDDAARERIVDKWHDEAIKEQEHSMLTIQEIRELVDIDGVYRYNDGEIALAAYFRGVLNKPEVAYYAESIYGNNVPTWLKAVQNA